MKFSLIIFVALVSNSFGFDPFKHGVDLVGSGDPRISAQDLLKGDQWGAQTSNKNSVNANTGDGNWKGGANTDGSQNGQDSNGNTAKKISETSFVANGNDGTSANADTQGRNGINTKYSDGNGFNMQGTGDENTGQGEAVNANDPNQKYRGWKEGATGFGSDPDGKVYKIDGIQQGANQVVVSGDGKQYTATKNDRETSFVEKPTNLWGFGRAANYKSDVVDAGNGVKQTQVHTSNVPVYRGEIDEKARTSRILDPVTGKATLVETQVNQVQESTCHPNWVGQANPPQKFKILKDTIRMDIPPKSKNGDDISYEWPTCVNAQVTIEIPANTNVRELGAQLTVALPETGIATCGDEYKCGPLECFQKNLCSAAAPIDPSGQQKNIPDYLFAKSDSGNTCQSQSNVRLPITVKICPTENGMQDQDVFKQTTAFYARNGDMTVQVRGYRITNLTTCDLKDLTSPLLGQRKIELLECRQAVISYTMNVGGLPKFNSFAQQKAQFANDADKLSMGQVTGENIGVSNNIFGQAGNLFGGGGNSGGGGFGNIFGGNSGGGFGNIFGGGTPAAAGPAVAAPAPAVGGSSNPFASLGNLFGGGNPAAAGPATAGSSNPFGNFGSLFGKLGRKKRDIFE